MAYVPIMTGRALSWWRVAAYVKAHSGPKTDPQRRSFNDRSVVLATLSSNRYQA